MLGLIGTVGGAVALEIRRIRHRGSVDEARQAKENEKELKRLLEVTSILLLGLVLRQPAGHLL